MSDRPEGGGWWQASDGRWYPPRQISPPVAAKPRRRWVLPVSLLVVFTLVASVAAFFIGSSLDEADASVLLEESAAAGPDPFTDSVTITEVAEFPDTVNAVITTTIDELPTDPVTGTLTAAGNTPGLYGGTKNDAACNTAALTDYLTNPDNTSKANAWARAAGVTVDDIGPRIAAFTPTVLTTDTRVTNNGYSNGQPTPRQSVLQAGTAVLVDDYGVPRVRCSCGNPLSEPSNIDLTNATFRGTRWATWNVDTVTTPAPAPEPIASFTLTDTTTGDPYQQPAPTAAPAAPDTTTAPPAPAGNGAKVVIGLSGLDVLDETGAVTETISYYEDPTAAVERLTKALGRAPVLTNEYDEILELTIATSAWDGFHLVSDGYPEPGEGGDFDVSLLAPTPGVTGPNGVQPGWSTAQVMQTFPDAKSSGDAGWGPGMDALLLQGTTPGAADGVGLVAFTQDSVVTRVSSPAFYLPAG